MHADPDRRSHHARSCRIGRVKAQDRSDHSACGNKDPRRPLNFTQPRTQTNRTTRQNTHKNQCEMHVPVVEILINLRRHLLDPSARREPVRAVGICYQGGAHHAEPGEAFPRSWSGGSPERAMSARCGGCRNEVRAITEAPKRLRRRCALLPRRSRSQTPVAFADAGPVRRRGWRSRTPLAFAEPLGPPGPYSEAVRR